MNARRRSLFAVLLAALLVVPLTQSPASAETRDPFGSAAGLKLNSSIVGIAATPTGKGYWMVAGDGGVFAYGDAKFLGSMGGKPLNKPIVGVASTASGDGYWLVASDGGVFAYGDATFMGSMGGKPLNKPVVGIASTSTGKGYWMVASDGGIFAYGDAKFLGSMGGKPLNKPITGMAGTSTGSGYWMVGEDGGVFAYGNAAFMGSVQSASRVAGIARTSNNDGYWLVAENATVSPFGQANSATAGSPGSRVVGVAASYNGYWLAGANGGVSSATTEIPSLSVSVVEDGLTVPWDMAFLPDGRFVYTERNGKVSLFDDGTSTQLATVPDVYRAPGEDFNETGLFGVAIDPDFANNRRFYTCYTWTDGADKDLRMSGWTMAPDSLSATRDATPIIDGMQMIQNYHFGCRLKFDSEGYLWMTTGDGGYWDKAADTSVINGKTLRMDTSGNPAPGNPFGNLIMTMGHRNVQGLAFRPGTDQVYSVEHGGDRDDEVNRLIPGANYGWWPGETYNVDAMTNYAKFPDAKAPIWASGYPTLATSGAEFLKGTQWKAWDGALVVATLKTSHLRLFLLDANGNVVHQQLALEGYGRMRTPVMGPDGSLYVTTSNGNGQDKILKVTPN